MQHSKKQTIKRAEYAMHVQVLHRRAAHDLKILWLGHAHVKHVNTASQSLVSDFDKVVSHQFGAVIKFDRWVQALPKRHGEEDVG